MTVSVPASDVQKDFSLWRDKALAGESVRVVDHGQESVYIVSAETFHALKQARREALLAAQLSDAEMEAIERAEIPVADRYTLDDPD